MLPTETADVAEGKNQIVTFKKQSVDHSALIEKGKIQILTFKLKIPLKL